MEGPISISSSVMQDSTGPVSLNDSLGPPSLQEESITEVTDSYEVKTKIIEDDNVDVFGASKMETSISTCDSGLIGK